MRERLAPGMIVGGRFQVEATIGRGDVGEVYRVKDPKTGLSYVLKLFTSPAMQDPHASGAFERASKQAGQLAQEFVAIQELGMDPNGPFALSTAVSSRPLDRYIEKKGPLSPNELVELMRCLGPAFDRAHGSGLVHGDLKPQNVFYGSGLKGPVVRVTDFGAIFLRMAAPAPWPCAYGWCSPEQVGGSPLAATMDVYGLALVAFYALVGRPMFLALKLPTPEPPRLWEEMHTLPSVSERAAELGGVIAAAFDGVFRRALAPQPHERFGSVGEFVRELEQAALVAPGPASIASAPAAPRGPVVPPPLVSGSGGSAMHGTQVLDGDAVEKARAEIDALLAARKAAAGGAASAPIAAPPPVAAPSPFAAQPPFAPQAPPAPPPVAGPQFSPGGVAPPPAVGSAFGGAPPPMAPPPVVGSPFGGAPQPIAPPPVGAAELGGAVLPPMVGGAVAPPPVVSAGFGDLAPPAVVSAPSDPSLGESGGAKPRKVYGTMVADGSEAFAMLESLGISHGGPPPPAPGHASMPLPAGKSSPFAAPAPVGGPSQPAMVIGGAAGLSTGGLGHTRADGGGVAAPPANPQPAPNPLGQSILGLPVPEPRRDATIMYSPPSSSNKKLIAIVVGVLLLVFVLGAVLIGWALSLDDVPPPPESSLGGRAPFGQALAVSPWVDFAARSRGHGRFANG